MSLCIERDLVASGIGRALSFVRTVAIRFWSALPRDRRATSARRVSAKGMFIRCDRLRIASENFLGIDAYRYESLDYFFGMAEQVHIEVAA